MATETQEQPLTQTEQTSEATTETPPTETAAVEGATSDTSTILTSTTEAPKADGETTEGEKTEAPAKVVPEGDYEIAVTDADGQPIVLDKGLVDALTPMAREMGWSNEDASRVAQFYADTVLPKLGEQFNAQLVEGVQKQRTEWREQVDTMLTEDAAQPEGQRVFDGKSAKDAAAIASKSFALFGGDTFRDFLDETGLGNHPAMLRGLYQVGKAMTEDGFASGATTAPVPKTREQKYYPNA